MPASASPMGSPLRMPFDEATGRGIDDFGSTAQHFSRAQVNEVGPCGDMGEVRKQELIRCRGMKLTLAVIEWARS
ncbi:hypothetical protein ASE94_00085 [Devosia sp. Leaf64]|nr:hypothetical protein ASE94_00085 [Devosia sp. Leaf64]